MRLDKYISNATDLSRSEAKRLIKAGDVSIDEKIATSGSQKVSTGHSVTIDGSPITLLVDRYFMMNKPAGVVSATKDHSNPTAIDLIYEHRNDQLQIAGRLDIDTTGLLLITDDGQWNHIVTSPRTDCKKIYLVELENPVGEDYQRKLEAGIALEGEKRRCLPATMEVIDEHHIRLTISEGKYHQVKRMMTSLGNQVVSLHRMQIGGIELDSELEPGDYRPLTDEEIASIQ
ncbi:MAG: Ribosomal small subunit pseudouridine synthase A [Cellvibrionales bacterium UBA7375]|nr:16S rRNA pseudouridine(516) synthase RsuA [Gammaproteobacteria bacterium]CAI8158378.1 MAG: Ribosomal small subunit pseudouridine synthase A [Cellvibrionales bacterium UBA7375]